MQVYAFVGKSGTGKSYRAQDVAKKYGKKYIIDEAILIKSTKVIAGKSAKTEANFIASVKAAIFSDQARREEMTKVIQKENPDKLLILGTSDDMIQRIRTNLGLEEICHTIYIEEVATPEQMEEARKSRMEDGKHVVPVPTFEIKDQFSGYFLDSLKIFNLFNREENDEKVSEKTIIRPTYSYLGKFYISPNVINDIISYVVRKVDGVSKVLKVNTQKYVDGMKLDIDIEIKFGKNIPKLSSEIKNVVIYAVDNATGINLFGININVKSITK